MYIKNIAETSVNLLTSGDEGLIGETMNKYLANTCNAGVFCSTNHDTFLRTKILDIETNTELARVKNLFQGRGLWA